MGGQIGKILINKAPPGVKLWIHLRVGLKLNEKMTSAKEDLVTMNRILKYGGSEPWVRGADPSAVFERKQELEHNLEYPYEAWGNDIIEEVGKEMGIEIGNIVDKEDMCPGFSPMTEDEFAQYIDLHGSWEEFGKAMVEGTLQDLALKPLEKIPGVGNLVGAVGEGIEPVVPADILKKVYRGKAEDLRVLNSWLDQTEEKVFDDFYLIGNSCGAYDQACYDCDLNQKTLFGPLSAPWFEKNSLSRVTLQFGNLPTDPIKLSTPQSQGGLDWDPEWEETWYWEEDNYPATDVAYESYPYVDEWGAYDWDNDDDIIYEDYSYP
jgi:hypothetical protein